MTPSPNHCPLLSFIAKDNATRLSINLKRRHGKKLTQEKNTHRSQIYRNCYQAERVEPPDHLSSMARCDPSGFLSVLTF